MPAHPTRDKTIHGEPVAHRVFLNTIADAISEMPNGGRAGDLIPVLGPEWDTVEARRLINQSLVNLTNANKLRRVEGERGLYVVSSHWRRTGTNRFDELEKTLLRVIAARGGFARWHEIMEDCDCAVKGSKEQREIIVAGTLYRQINDILSRSTRIRKDITSRAIGHGIYNVPWDEMSRLPIIGRYANRYLWYTTLSIWQQFKSTATETFDKDEWRQERDKFFNNVGWAFMRLRNLANLEVEDVVEQRTIKAALLKMQTSREKPNRDLVRRLEEQIRAEIDVEIEALRADGITAEVQEKVAVLKEQRDERMRKGLPTKLYEHFEAGDLGAHCSAPLDLYTSVATFYEVCPAALSRGAILLLPDADKLHRDNYRRYRSVLEEVDAELANERALEETRRLLDAPLDEM